MKTPYILAAYRNATSTAARLAAWQSRPLRARMRDIRERLAAKYCAPENMKSARHERVEAQSPELSAPENPAPYLWTGKESPEVMGYFPGRDFLDHHGWYADLWQDDTLETYAVRLSRFPRLMFYAVLNSASGDLRVHLDSWVEIDFNPAAASWDAPSEAIHEAAKEIIRSHESTTQREAEKSVEYFRRDSVEREIEENREEIRTLRGKIRALARELKTLCPSPLVTEYPAAASAVRDTLQGLIRQRADLFSMNQNLSATL